MYGKKTKKNQAKKSATSGAFVPPEPCTGGRRERANSASTHSDGTDATAKWTSRLRARGSYAKRVSVT